MNLVPCATPNFDARPPGSPILLIVLHADASPAFSATRSWIASEKSQVSYHVEVDRDGTGYRFVEDTERAWAVGKSEWKQFRGLNRISLSAAFANRNDGKEPLTPLQIAWMVRMIAHWRARHPLIESVVTHAMVSPGRKFDPIRAPNFRLEQFA